MTHSQVVGADLYVVMGGGEIREVVEGRSFEERGANYTV